MNQEQKVVAKLIMVDQDDRYLLMYRSDHPEFGVDPDLPGGTLEEGESALETMVREVEEESGVIVDGSTAKELYSGTKYSGHDTLYVLYVSKFSARPEITMSWEHSSYEWLTRDEFVEKSKAAKDVYMHMVADALEGKTATS